jgi:hypothetical protein
VFVYKHRFKTSYTKNTSYESYEFVNNLQNGIDKKNINEYHAINYVKYLYKSA